MTIDWDKPLLIKGKNDGEWHVTHYDTGSIMRDIGGRILRVIKFTTNGFESEWVVDEDGEDVNGIMPRVYNAKRKPKDYEWWVCTNSTYLDIALQYRKGDWYCGDESWANVEPKYPLIKDPSFQE